MLRNPISRNTEIESTTKFDENNTDLPTNPFEIVNMIRKAQSMNDATDPTDAIDDALKSFYKTENKEWSLIKLINLNNQKF